MAFIPDPNIAIEHLLQRTPTTVPLHCVCKMSDTSCEYIAHFIQNTLNWGSINKNHNLHTNVYGYTRLKEISIFNSFEQIQENTISGSAFSARLGSAARTWLSYLTQIYRVNIYYSGHVLQWTPTAVPLRLQNDRYQQRIHCAFHPECIELGVSLQKSQRLLAYPGLLIYDFIFSFPLNRGMKAMTAKRICFGQFVKKWRHFII